MPHEPTLAEHLLAYGIRSFSELYSFEAWAAEQLGARWKQRLDHAYGDLTEVTARARERGDIGRLFDSSAHAKIARVSLSYSYAALYNIGDATTSLIRGRARILDVGCNIGHLTTWYARVAPGRTVTGVDISGACVTSARLVAGKLGVRNVEFRAGDIEQCELEGPYDAIVESLCFNYLRDLEGTLRRLVDRLEPQGVLISSRWLLGAKNEQDYNGLLAQLGLVEVRRLVGSFPYLGRVVRTALIAAAKMGGDCRTGIPGSVVSVAGSGR